MEAETTCLNSDPTSGNFTLSITQMNQYGVYICNATNDLGTDVASIEIIQASKSIIYDTWAPNPRYLWALSCSVSGAMFLSRVDASGWLCRIIIVTVSMGGRVSSFDFDLSSGSSSFESSGFVGSGTIEGLLEAMTELT